MKTLSILVLSMSLALISTLGFAAKSDEPFPCEDAKAKLASKIQERESRIRILEGSYKAEEGRARASEGVDVPVRKPYVDRTELYAERSRLDTLKVLSSLVASEAFCSNPSAFLKAAKKELNELEGRQSLKATLNNLRAAPASAYNMDTPEKAKEFDSTRAVTVATLEKLSDASPYGSREARRVEELKKLIRVAEAELAPFYSEICPGETFVFVD